MSSRLLLLCVCGLLVGGSSADAETTLVYDDGGEHVLDSSAPFDSCPQDSTVEVRDGPGSDPTSLDVQLDDYRLILKLEVYDQSALQLSLIAGAGVTAWDDSEVTWTQPTVDGGHNNGISTRNRSTATISGYIGGASARDESTVIFDGGTGVFSGRDDSTSFLNGGEMFAVLLYDSASLHVGGGSVGSESVDVTGSAYLLVEGAGSLDDGAYYFHVKENGVADLRSGEIDSDSYPNFSIQASDQGLVRFFGEDWALDGVPIGPGDISGRSGRLTGTFESGDSVSVDVGVGEAAIIRFVPEPGAGMLVVAALAVVAGLRTRQRH